MTSSALPAPGWSGLPTQWTWQPIALLAVLGAALWYARGVRTLGRTGVPWPVRRTIGFGAGLALTVWISCGFLGAYATSVYWAWTGQSLALWLGVPAILLTGKPLHLAEAVAPDGVLPRLLRTRPARVLANPLVAPAVVPVVSAVLFFGPLPGWAIQTPIVGWLLQVVLLALGTVLLLPLLGVEQDVSGLAVAGALAIGMIELILDAIPGIVLRLHHSLATSYFDHITTHAWTTAHLHDQQTAGTVLWVVAEVIDLPFLLVVFRRWLRADARDAAAVDALLEAERAARGVPDAAGSDGLGPSDAPWWLSDPTTRHRFEGPG